MDMNDRELIVLAGKASGKEPSWVVANFATGGKEYLACGWNPLDVDGDAFRLAMKLHLKIEILETGEWLIDGRKFKELKTIDNLKYVRRAIVLAAAEIGKRMA